MNGNDRHGSETTKEQRIWGAYKDVCLDFHNDFCRGQTDGKFRTAADALEDAYPEIIAEGRKEAFS